MSNQRYPEEFKIEAVKHITERGLRVADVAERLGVSAHSLYAWVKRYSKPQAQRQQVDDQQAGVSIAAAALGEGPAGIKSGLSVKEDAEIWSVVMVPPCGRPVTEDKATLA